MIKQAEKAYAPLEVEKQVEEFWNRARVYAKTVEARSKGEDCRSRSFGTARKSTRRPPRRDRKAKTSISVTDRRTRPARSIWAKC